MIRQETEGQWKGMWVVTLRNGQRVAYTTKEEAYRAWRDSIIKARREIAKKERDRIGRIQFASAGATRKR